MNIQQATPSHVGNVMFTNRFKIHRKQVKYDTYYPAIDEAAEASLLERQATH